MFCSLSSKSLLYSAIRYPKYLKSVTCSIIGDNYELHISVVAGKWTSLVCAVFDTIPCSKYSAVYITITGNMVPSAYGP